MISIRSLDTMTGRIFLILLVGIVSAGAIGLSVSEQRRAIEVRQIQAARAIERTGAFLTAFETTAPVNRNHEAREPRRFVRLAGSADRSARADPALTALLHRQLPPMVRATVASVPVMRCEISGDGEEAANAEPGYDRAVRPTAAAWKAVVAATDCWRIDVRLGDGTAWAFVTGPPPLLPAPYGFDRASLSVVAIAAAALAFAVARIAGSPIRKLTRAASQVKPDARSSPLAETGPSDVRGAIQAFNDMQARLARHATEQTYIIAAVTHDLQTPMTRFRLKLQGVQDKALQARLLSDWRAMRSVVEEGLELARSASSVEAPVLLDVDSLIHSIVEDERDAGHDASFDIAAGLDWRCRPQMLRRCLQNLVDNAVTYGGAAHLSTHVDSAGLRIEVRDPGPGIPADQLDAVFEPMVRLEESRSRATGGTGLGLTIARNLASRMGASLTIKNAHCGGLICIVRFR